MEMAKDGPQQVVSACYESLKKPKPLNIDAAASLLFDQRAFLDRSMCLYMRVGFSAERALMRVDFSAACAYMRGLVFDRRHCSSLFSTATCAGWLKGLPVAPLLLQNGTE